MKDGNESKSGTKKAYLSNLSGVSRDHLSENLKPVLGSQIAEMLRKDNTQKQGIWRAGKLVARIVEKWDGRRRLLSPQTRACFSHQF